MLGNPVHVAPEICSGNTNPHCTGLWGVRRLHTRESWSTVGGQESCCLWRRGMPVTPAKNQHGGGSLKDSSPAEGTPEGRGLAGALSGGERAGRVGVPALSQPAPKCSIIPDGSPTPQRQFSAYVLHLAQLAQQQSNFAEWQVEGR